ncbi:hypothetical protein ADK67_07190 [Saccharothrix sp. NRRL B-16348]|uniref:hypothetical protein n=1 Tax=Saccharothrix sp. NRRL B-16348 TaxID=1415542 RepID=UPI0006ADFF19|nr:hypothetical protein [Saccharothrix sp. NRRL B-16348]KOX32968.1 hypothetical protein ADK67_07190 [Saccharothrix sp. NRRL B-16348]
MTAGQRSSEIAGEVGDRQVVRAVTVIIGVVVGLTFVFGFGNVLGLALGLGVPIWVAPLVAPAVDLSVLALLLAGRHLAMCGAAREQLQPARRLLIFSSLVTLALNVADPLVAGRFGKAAFDAVGPLLLIGWAEVGPGLLRAVNGTAAGGRVDAVVEVVASAGAVVSDAADDLLRRARVEDARHWESHRRPISAETLRGRLRIGARRARRLVEMVRSERADTG